MANSQDSTHDENDAARVQRLSQTAGLDPVLKQQLETTLHAGYEFNAKYAKYGVVWVWFFWALKWGFAAAITVALFGGIVIALGFGLNSPWFLWIGASLPLGLGFGFFALFHAAMRKAHDTELKLASQYQAATNGSSA